MHDKSEVSEFTVVYAIDSENLSENFLLNISSLGGNKPRKLLNSYSKGFSPIIKTHQLDLSHNHLYRSTYSGII